MAAISNLCVVETVKSWRGKGDEEEGVVVGAEEGNSTIQNATVHLPLCQSKSLFPIKTR